MLDKSKFIEIIKDNEGLIYKVARVYSDGDEMMKDLYQEIVYQLWKSFASFKGTSKVSTWIYRVALNTSITFSKKEKLFKKNMIQDVHFSLIAVDPNEELRIRLMYEQIHQLSSVEKGLILLYLEGKNYEEIAHISGFTKTNVATKLSRIKRKLKSKIVNA